MHCKCWPRLCVAKSRFVNNNVLYRLCQNNSKTLQTTRKRESACELQLCVTIECSLVYAVCNCVSMAL